MSTALIIILSVAMVAMTALAYFTKRNASQIQAEMERLYLEDLEKKLAWDSFITPTSLEEYGFVIHPTKSTTYAIHKSGGVSLTKLRNRAWTVEIRDGKNRWKATMNTIGPLIDFCNKYNNPIKQEEES